MTASRYKDNFTNVSINNETYEELIRRKINPKESMDTVIKRTVNKDVSGYKQDVDLQNKIDLLTKIKKSHESLIRSLDSLNKDIEESIKR